MIKVGDYNRLQVQRFNQTGAFLNDGKEGLLLPKRFVPEDAKVGDELDVFVYHDSEGRLIATTLHPNAVVRHHLQHHVALRRYSTDAGCINYAAGRFFRLGFDERFICAQKQTDQPHAFGR